MESRACISTSRAILHPPPLATSSRGPSTPPKCTRVTPHARQAAYMWQKLGDNPERAHDQHGALSPVNGYGAAPLDAGAAAHTRPHHSHPLLSHYLRYTFGLPHSCPSPAIVGLLYPGFECFYFLYRHILPAYLPTYLPLSIISHSVPFTPSSCPLHPHLSSHPCPPSPHSP